jgi:hypothetical protein
MDKESRVPLLRLFALVLAFAFTMFPSPSAALMATFTDFSTGFDVVTDTGNQTQNGVTFSYSDDGVIELRTATADYLDIKNSYDADGHYLGYFNLSFSGVPTGHYLEIDLDGFYYDTTSLPDNNELMYDFSTLPDSVVTNGPLWTGTELHTTNSGIGTATLRYEVAPSTLTIGYGSTSNHVFFLLTEMRIGEITNTQPVPEPATMLLFGTGLVGLVGVRLRKKKK